jgi:hypothetical protein
MSFPVDIQSRPASASYKFKPGGGGVGPVEYQDWAALEAAKEAHRVDNPGSSYIIEVDDTVVSPAVMPAGGPYNLVNCKLRGGDKVTELDLAIGSSATGFRHVEKNLTIQNRTLTPFDSSLANNDIIVIDLGCAVTSKDGSAAVWDASSLAPGEAVSILANRVSHIGGGGTSSAPILTGFAANTICVSVLGVGSSLQNESIVGASGAFLLQRYSSPVQWALQTSWLGTEMAPTLYNSPGFLPNPFRAAAATASITLAFGEWGRFDVSGGAVSQDMPSINAANASRMYPGGLVMVSEVTNTAGLTLNASSGDTINGSASFAVPAGATAILASDGVSDWRIISVYP